MKKQSFLTGTVILMIANAISKILGAVLKIPLSYILKEEGMAVYNIAFEAYIMFLAFIISGLPFAVSKLSAEASSLGKKQREHKIVTSSTLFLTIIGAVGSVVLYFSAPFLSIAMKEERAVYAIRMIAPSVFFVALGTGYKSYFQGVSNMIPVALSQVAESFIKLAAGYALAIMFVSFGTEKAAGGAIMGVTAGEIIATAILALAYIFRRKEVYIKSGQESTYTILREILSLALPLLCASVISNALAMADTTLTRTRLLDAGIAADNARFLYGAYTGYALTVFHLPVGILATLGVSILPVISGAYATGNERRAKSAAEMGIRLSVILSVPCSIAMYVLSDEILGVLFHNTNSAMMLKTVAPCAVTMCITQMSAAILQSAGKIMIPFYNSLAGMAVKLVLGYVLIGNPEINIYGSALSFAAANTVVLVLNFVAIKRNLGIKLQYASIIIKPLLCGSVMYAVLYLALPYLKSYGDIITLLCAGGGAAVVYMLSLMLTGTISVSEVKHMLAK